MSDEDFIIEEDGSNRRSFMIIAGVLATIFVAAAICSGVYLLSGRSSSSNPQATAIAATNAVILITNEAVTVAIEMTETAAAMPTNTPEPTETATETPTAVPDTPEPTETPVVEVEETATPNLSGTSTFEEVEGTETAESAIAATATPIPAATSTAGNDSLPETGFDTWGVLLAGGLLVFVLLVARRLRTMS